MNYKSNRIIDGKPKWVIVDEDGNIINKNANKEELKNLQIEQCSKGDCARKYNPTYTDEELLEYLRLFNRENGRTPESRDFNYNIKYPHSNTYKKRFGSWNKALKMAKLRFTRFANVTDKELLESLTQFFTENERSPTWEDFTNNNKYPSFKTYQIHFGSWNNALKMAGLKTNNCKGITDHELLELLVQFSKENGRSPTQTEFNNSAKYPSYGTYINRFGSWQKALKLVELDVDSMVKKGIIETYQQKARQSEICILNHFTKKGSIDLSGNNCNSPFDGICPKGETYDVKSSSLFIDYWMFNLDNTYRENIEWLYLCAYDNYHKNLLYVWRIPSNFIDGDKLYIGLNNNKECNIKNMKEYDITEKFKEIHKQLLNR